MGKLSFMSLGLALIVLDCLPNVAVAQSAPDEKALIDQGRYIATAGDCGACHKDPSGTSDYGGGMPIASPLGNIYASNITPDPVHGIGKWTFQQFSDAMRKGQSPKKGWLYPAMPYTAYAGMSDQDLRAMYAYLTKAVPPSANQPPETKLPFPFMRPAMMGWNSLFLNSDAGRGADAPVGSAERGFYVAEALEHCSTCHTPRNALFAEEKGKLLAGASLGAWYAPNITPNASGIADWSDAEIASFLTTGRNAHAVAGGDMGLAVQRSLSQLKPDDIQAIVAYLRSVPKVETAAAAPVQPVPPLNIAAAEPQQGRDFQKIIAGSRHNGAVLYQSACASCHGANGEGSADGQHPALAPNTTVRAARPDNLVMAISTGIHRTIGGYTYAMPGFAGELDNSQIAALATYVRQNFGGLENGAVTADQVATIRAGKVSKSWLVDNAQWLSIVGIAVAILILLFIFKLIFGGTARRRRVRTA